MPTLPVELNGDGVHSIRAPDRFTTTQPFAVEFENLGRSTHVHLHLDDELDRAASIGTANHYVEDESIRRVHVSVTAVDETVRGKLKIVTGYGSGVEYVDVRIDPPVETGADGVVVDETLSKPPERSPDPPPKKRLAMAIDRTIEAGGLPTITVALAAALAAVVIAVAVDSVLVSLLVAVVLTAAVAAVLVAVW
ncbi:DUF7524 family protein [Halorubrum sp. DTA98]|uniref:DUF7524 family protein n=1 Tax=Halorubrum sp. DTA98 TaxID=3402163 RepID=UPI003AAEA3CA